MVLLCGFNTGKHIHLATHFHAMLEIHNLSLAIPMSGQSVPAVSDVSLNLKPGRVLGLVGESGCGKTLTAQAILRLGEYQNVERSGGKILLDEQNLFELDAESMRRIRGGRISMIFQEPMTALNPVFSIGEQIAEVIRLHVNHLDRQQARQRAISLLQDVGLQDAEALLSQYPDALSGGMRQRVLIAMAMAAEPQYIIADEPTTALDVSVQNRIIRLLRRLQKENGQGMLLVTHDFGLVAELADEVAVMYAGQIVEFGSVKEIFDHPSHPYTRALMHCRPEGVHSDEKLQVIPGQVPPPGRWGEGCRFSPRCAFATEACNAAMPAADAWQTDQHIARCIRVDAATKETAA